MQQIFPFKYTITKENMDIVYHRNCLDGVYSAYAMYLFAKSLTPQSYQQFVSNIQNGQADIYGSIEKDPASIQITSKYELKEVQAVNEQFFHAKPQIPFRSISMFAGEFFPLSPPQKGNTSTCIIVDTSPTELKHLGHLSEVYSQVIIIDHHSSFRNCKQILDKEKFKNIYYFWKEGKCAAELVLEFLRIFTQYPFNYPLQIREKLKKTIQYVGKNDLKKDQDRESKQFVLGFYYFEIELSHHNPWLFKRLWSLDLDSIFKKGSNAYKIHFDMLRQAVENCEIARVEKGKYKGTQFLAFPLTDRGITSDLGSVLSFISTKLGFDNLAMIYNKSSTEIRISFRSYQHVQKEPLALKLAQNYGGGGHVCAAGCQMVKNLFKSHIHLMGKLKPSHKLSQQELEKILFVS